jgi:hypothetical protein
VACISGPYICGLHKEEKEETEIKHPTALEEVGWDGRGREQNKVS